MVMMQIVRFCVDGENYMDPIILSNKTVMKRKKLILGKSSFQCFWKIENTKLSFEIMSILAINNYPEWTKT